MKNTDRLIVATTVILMIIVALTVMHINQQNQINNLKRDMCAWIIYEDGSVEERTDDLDRFKCMEGR